MKIFVPVSALVLLSLARVSWAAPVSVQVLGPDKKPVPGAQIRVHFWSFSDVLMKTEPLKAQADAKGQAIFEAPDAKPFGGGDFLGFATAWSPNLSLATSIVQAKSNTITLGASGVARGVVVDEKGQPVVGALVHIAGMSISGGNGGNSFPAAFSLKSDEDISSTHTDAQGHWTLSHGPVSGQLGVTLGDDKFASSSAAASVVEAGAAFDWAPLEAAAREAAHAPVAAPSPMGVAGGNLSGGLVARPASTITGRVVDPEGAPVVGINVIATAQRGSSFVFSPSSATTDAKGEFSITRLNAGDYNLSPFLNTDKEGAQAVPKATWVPGEPLKVTVGAGASVASGDVKMIRGGVIEVRLLDEVTGKGIAGGQVYAHSSNDFVSAMMPGTSDAEGRVTLRLPPGKQNLLLQQAPKDYLSPQHATYNDPTPITVVAGATQSVVWKLKKGLSGAGRVLDEKGQPVPNLSINFRNNKEEWWSSSKSAQSDAAGKWSLGSFEPGVWKPYIQGAEWKVVGPKEATFPLKAALDITVAPIAKLTVSGKVVDGDGAPLPDAHVALKIQAVQENMGSQVESAATTKADGTWSVADVPEIAQSISIQVTRAGYGVDHAPVATKTEGTQNWSVTDALLKKRDSRLGGQVLDAAGQPSNGAQVLVAQTTLVADKEGRWKLGDLPAGETEIVAVNGSLSAVSTTNAPNDNVSLKLRAPQVLVGRDVERAQAVLQDAWETSRGSKYSNRDWIPSALAVADPDAALAMARAGADKAQKPDGGAGATLPIIRVLAQGDKETAQSWATAHLDALSDPSQHEQALLIMAQAMADSDAASAKKWLGLARTGYASLKEAWQQNLAAPRLAALAAQLKEPDANALFEQAFTLAKSPGNNQNDYAGLAWAVAPYSEEWVVKAIDAAVAAAPTQPEYSSGPDSAVGSAILRLAPVNLPAARRLLAKYGDVKGRNGQGTSWELSRARAVVLGQRAKAGEDVDALSKEALEQPQNQAQALALIAQNGPQSKRVELLKRALDIAEKQSQYNMGDMLQVLARLLPLDREAAKAGLERARAVLEAPRDQSNDYQRLRAEDVANWAWLERTLDPASARLMIEREWALGLALPTSDQDEWQRWPNMSKLVQALMPLDIERAQQLTERLPVAGYNAPAFEAQRAIARWMVASDKERAAKPLSFWSRDLEQENRYSPEW